MLIIALNQSLNEPLTYCTSEIQAVRSRRWFRQLHYEDCFGWIFGATQLPGALSCGKTLTKAASSVPSLYSRPIG